MPLLPLGRAVILLWAVWALGTLASADSKDYVLENPPSIQDRLKMFDAPAEEGFRTLPKRDATEGSFRGRRKGGHVSAYEAHLASLKSDAARKPKKHVGTMGLSVADRLKVYKKQVAEVSMDGVRMGDVRSDGGVGSDATNDADDEGTPFNGALEAGPLAGANSEKTNVDAATGRSVDVEGSLPSKVTGLEGNDLEGDAHSADEANTPQRILKEVEEDTPFLADIGDDELPMAIIMEDKTGSEDEGLKTRAARGSEKEDPTDSVSLDSESQDDGDLTTGEESQFFGDIGYVDLPMATIAKDEVSDPNEHATEARPEDNSARGELSADEPAVSEADWNGIIEEMDVLHKTVDAFLEEAEQTSLPNVDDGPILSGADSWEDDPEVQMFRNVVTEDVMRGVKRVIFFGDLHGDPMAFQGVIKMLNLNERSKEETLIVSTGDFMDRGPEDMGIWKSLWSLRERGYKIVLVNGNHEAMVASGDWRYRNLLPVLRRGARKCKEALSGEVHVMQCLKFVKDALEVDKTSLLTCSGSFNKFIRDVTSPVAVLTHPLHGDNVVISHGGVSVDFITTVKKTLSLQNDGGMSGFVTSINDVFKRGVDNVCRSWYPGPPEVGQECTSWSKFHPMINTKPFDTDVNHGMFGRGTRTETCDSENYLDVDMTWKYLLSAFRVETPSWDRTLYRRLFSNSGSREAQTSMLDEVKDAFDQVTGVTKIRQVVGHTEEGHGIRSAGAGQFFGIDTAMSRGLCTSKKPCPYSVLIFENFGTKEWATEPVIYRKSIQMSGYESFENARVQCDILGGDREQGGIIDENENSDHWGVVECSSIGESVPDVPDVLAADITGQP